MIVLSLLVGYNLRIQRLNLMVLLPQVLEMIPVYWLNFVYRGSAILRLNRILNILGHEALSILLEWRLFPCCHIGIARLCVDFILRLDFRYCVLDWLTQHWSSRTFVLISLCCLSIAALINDWVTTLKVVILRAIVDRVMSRHGVISYSVRVTLKVNVEVPALFERRSIVGIMILIVLKTRGRGSSILNCVQISAVLPPSLELSLLKVIGLSWEVHTVGTNCLVTCNDRKFKDLILRAIMR